MRKKSLALILAFAVLAGGIPVGAQIQDTDIVLSISPEHPGPNQEVIATLNSYSINLNKANIFWSVNNQEESGGIGRKSFSFRTGSSRSTTTLSVTIDTIDGQSILKTVTITPAGVDLLWEAYNAYTPPFYRGKALAPSQGIFKVTAIPNLSGQSGRINPNNLSYAWKLDGNGRPSSSGWGKNYLTFQNSYLETSNTVEVKVSDISGEVSASGRVALRTSDPKILFYQDDASLGVRWEKSLEDGFSMNPNGETIIAEPYFFSPKNIDSPQLAFDWILNGQKIEAPNPKNILSIKPDGGQSGSASIKLIVENLDTLFQKIEKEISVSF